MEVEDVYERAVEAIGPQMRAGGRVDQAGADALLLHMTADVVIADKAYDADKRVIRPLASTGKSAVIPPRRNRSAPREFDPELYKARHLIENFFCKLK